MQLKKLTIITGSQGTDKEDVLSRLIEKNKNIVPILFDFASFKISEFAKKIRGSSFKGSTKECIESLVIIIYEVWNFEGLKECIYHFYPSGAMVIILYDQTDDFLEDKIEQAFPKAKVKVEIFMATNQKKNHVPNVPFKESFRKIQEKEILGNEEWMKYIDNTIESIGGIIIQKNKDE